MTTPTLREALQLIADTDPIDAALDPQRAVRVARAALAQPVPDAPAEPLQLWCDTCEGTGKVYQEHQRGCHVGGEFPCPDCDGNGYVISTRFVLAAAHPQQPARVPLTDAQILALRIFAGEGPATYFDKVAFARAIEAAHGIVPAPTTESQPQR